jgi:hypothetical protein
VMMMTMVMIMIRIMSLIMFEEDTTYIMTGARGHLQLQSATMEARDHELNHVRRGHQLYHDRSEGTFTSNQRRWTPSRWEDNAATELDPRAPSDGLSRCLTSLGPYSPRLPKA